jgi:hypothetical protein
LTGGTSVSRHVGGKKLLAPFRTADLTF